MKKSVVLISARIFASILVSTMGAAQADIVLDGSIGQPPENLALEGPDYNIGADLGEISGNNLFHSFDQFSVLQNESATFTGPQNIDNVVSRVTGGEISTIDGTLSVEMPKADFFLLNPAGVMVGEGASINVPGSFHVSTADNLQFADGGAFSAQPQGTPPTLTSAAPAAFGLLGDHAGNITIDDTQLTVNDQEDITLHAQNITTLNGATLRINGGAVKLDATNDINLTDSFINADNFGSGQGGAIHVNGNNIHLNGSLISSDNFGDGDVGEVIFSATNDIHLNNATIRGTVTLNAGDIHFNNSLIDADSFSNGRAVSLNANRDINFDSSGILAGNFGSSNQSSLVVISAERDITLNNGTTIFVDNFGSGDGGVMLISAAQKLTLNNSSKIDTKNQGTGRGSALLLLANTIDIVNNSSITGNTIDGEGGLIDIAGTESVQLLNGATIQTDTTGSGLGGILSINTPILHLQDSSITGNTINGEGGVIFITGTESVQLLNGATIETNTTGSGLGGSLSINTPILHLQDSRITGNTINGGGGVIVITGTESVQLRNDATIQTNTTGSGAGGILLIDTPILHLQGSNILSEAERAGNAGDIAIGGSFVNGEFASNGQPAGDLLLENHSNISVSTKTNSSGNAGNIDIRSNNTTLVNSAITSASQGVGIGGSVKIDADNDINLTANSKISAEATQANGGNVEITSNNNIFIDNSAITTNADQNGGEITINAPNIIHLRNSQVTAAAVGDGGNINIDPIFIIAENTTISANAINGSGGNINLVADFLITGGDTQITASSEFGVNGQTEVSATVADIAAKLLRLPSKLINSRAELRELCRVTLQKSTSNFTRTGRGGLPLSSQGWLPAFGLRWLEKLLDNNASP